ncbi:MAG: diguanylate cyclase [Pseudobutyrivibrio sp.]|nr:diguanylate cyclase [Pseudobutyrivibrio sp.]
MKRSLFIRRIIAIIYIAFVFWFIWIGFSYTNQSTNEYKEKTVFITDWTDHGEAISLPFKRADRQLELKTTLADVYDDEILVLKVYYDTFQVYIDDKLILESNDSTFFGHRTFVGNKEIWVPMDESYSYKDIVVNVKVQRALYRSMFSNAFISTRSVYAFNLIRINIVAIIFFVILTVTGILEIAIAGYFIIRKVGLIRKFSFHALFYAGCFSIVTAQWVINETRIPPVIWGKNTGFGVLTIISFLLMPLLFFEITRTLFLKLRKIDNIVDSILALSIILSIVPVLIGVYDWGYLIYAAHALDFIVMFLVGYYSYTILREENEITLKSSISIANFGFLILAVFAAINYVNNTSTNYIVIFLLDLLLYIFVQVGLIYRRIGLNVQEEKEFVQAKVYAFTDELTSLGNRRKFYNAINEFEKDELPKDLTYIAIDVNRLKYYNDTMGHEAGDELLVGTAECVKNVFPVEATNASRLGGDEFAILFVDSEDDVNSRIERLVDALEQWHGEFVENISIAFGVASLREENIDTIDEMARVADERMYMNKKKFYEKTGIDRRSAN